MYFLNILNIYMVLTMSSGSFIIYSPLWCYFFSGTEFLIRPIMWKQLPLQNGNMYLFNLWGVQIKRGCLRKKTVWVSPSSFLLFLRFMAFDLFWHLFELDRLKAAMDKGVTKYHHKSRCPSPHSLPDKPLSLKAYCFFCFIMSFMCLAISPAKMQTNLSSFRVFGWH